MAAGFQESARAKAREAYVPLGEIEPAQLEPLSHWPGLSAAAGHIGMLEAQIPEKAAVKLITGTAGLAAEDRELATYVSPRLIKEDRQHVYLGVPGHLHENTRMMFHGVVLHSTGLVDDWMESYQNTKEDSYGSIMASSVLLRKTWRAAWYDGEYWDSIGATVEGGRGAMPSSYLTALYASFLKRDGYYGYGEFQDFIAGVVAREAARSLRPWRGHREEDGRELAGTINDIARRGEMELFSMTAISDPYAEGVPPVDVQTQIAWSTLYALADPPSVPYLAKTDQNQLITLSAYMTSFSPKHGVSNQIDALARVHLGVHGLAEEDPLYHRMFSAVLGTSVQGLNSSQLGKAFTAARRIVATMKDAGFDDAQHAALCLRATSNAVLNVPPMLVAKSLAPKNNPQEYLRALDDEGVSRYSSTLKVEGAVQGAKELSFQCRFYSQSSDESQMIFNIVGEDKPMADGRPKDEITNQPAARFTVSLTDSYELMVDSVDMPPPPTSKDLAPRDFHKSLYLVAAWNSANMLLALRLRGIALRLGARSINRPSLDKLAFRIAPVEQLSPDELAALEKALSNAGGAKGFTVELPEFRAPSAEGHYDNIYLAKGEMETIPAGQYHVEGRDWRVLMNSDKSSPIDYINREAVALRHVEGIAYDMLGNLSKPPPEHKAILDVIRVATACGDQIEGDSWVLKAEGQEYPVRYQNVAYGISASHWQPDDGPVATVRMQSAQPGASWKKSLPMSAADFVIFQAAIGIIKQATFYGKINEAEWRAVREKTSGNSKMDDFLKHVSFT